MRLNHGINGIMVLVALALVGCDDRVADIRVDGTVRESVAPGAPPTIATSYNITTKAKPVIRRSCFPCHANTQPDGQGYAGGVEIHAGSPWTLVLPSGMSVQALKSAVCDGRAPANRALTAGEADTLNEYIVVNLGASVGNCYVPSSFSWSQSTHQSGLTIPGSGYQPGGYFGFAVEDMERPNLALASWNETDSTPNDYTKDVLAMSRYTATDSFYTGTPPSHTTISDDATIYVSPNGVPWNGRLRETTMKGYFQYRHRFFAVMHTQTSREGPTPATRRDSRTYVRLQVEQSGKLGLRMKKEGFSDNLETVGAWESSSGPSDLVDDTGAGLQLIETGISGINQGGRFYWLEFTATEDGAGTHYVGKLYTDDPALGGTLKATVGGLRANKTKAFGGFAWGWYERLGADKFNRMAEWNVTASSMEGSGTPQGGCKNGCDEYD